MTTTEPHPDILADRTDDPMGEALLLQAVRDGSTGAFGILYARYRKLAVGVALQVLPRGEVALAEDVAEVAFTRVLTALRNGKGPTESLRPYLTTTVRREAWRAQRRRRRQAEVVDRWAAGEDTTAPPPDVDLDLAGDGALSSHVLLGEAFRGLSPRWRHILWLTVVEGRKPAEVAPMLGVSAGSASALSYRARNGLVAAYMAVYRRSTDDAACASLADRLEAYVAAGAPAEGFADVDAHLEGCRSCREVTRGVDVLGSVLASMAPFGLLTAGWWAQTAGAGAAGLAAGGAAAAGAVGAAAASSTTAASTAASTTAASSAAAASTAGGIGVGGAVAAAAVVVVAGAAWFGATRSDPPANEVAGRRVVATTVADGPGTSVDGVEREAPATAVSVGAGPAVVDPPDPATSAPATSAPATSAPGTSAPAPSAPAPSVPGTAPTATSTVASTRPPVPTTEATTTTSLPPVAGPGTLTGRATRSEADGAEVPVPGIEVVAYDDQGRLAGTTSTAGDGRWSLPKVPKGRYLVVAVVPARYRPAAGEDPWTGGATWAAILGEVEVVDRALDLVDLRLVDR